MYGFWDSLCLANLNDIIKANRTDILMVTVKGAVLQQVPAGAITEAINNWFAQTRVASSSLRAQLFCHKLFV